MKINPSKAGAFEASFSRAIPPPPPPQKKKKKKQKKKMEMASIKTNGRYHKE